MKILIIGSDQRNDLIHPFVENHSFEEVYYIEYKSALKRNKKIIQDLVFWEDFTHAYHLINTLKPDKIIFYAIEELKHVAVKIAAKKMNIACIHLEHGLRNKDLKSENSPEIILGITKKISLPIRFLLTTFYFKTFLRSPPPSQLFMLKFFFVRHTSRIIDIGKKMPENKFLKMDLYISFSEYIFEHLSEEIHISKDTANVTYIGFIGYDKILRNPQKINEKKVVFIDQPLHEQNLFGWTEKNKTEFLIALKKKIEDLNYEFFIKPHPSSDRTIYEENNLKTEDQLVKILDAQVFIGFISTMLLPLSGLSNRIVVCIEKHPKNSELKKSFLLVENNLALGVNSPSEINLDVSLLENHLKEKEIGLKKLLPYYLYKVDGEAKERLTNAILNN